MTMFSVSMMQWNVMYRSRGGGLPMSNTQSVLMTTRPTKEKRWPISSRNSCSLRIIIGMAVTTQWMPTTASSQIGNRVVNRARQNTLDPITNRCHRNSMTSPGIDVSSLLERRVMRRSETTAQAMDTSEVRTVAIWSNSETNKTQKRH